MTTGTKKNEIFKQTLRTALNVWLEKKKNNVDRNETSEDSLKPSLKIFELIKEIGYEFYFKT